MVWYREVCCNGCWVVWIDHSHQCSTLWQPVCDIFIPPTYTLSDSSSSILIYTMSISYIITTTFYSHHSTTIITQHTSLYHHSLMMVPEQVLKLWNNKEFLARVRRICLTTNLFRHLWQVRIPLLVPDFPDYILK